MRVYSGDMYGPLYTFGLLSKGEVSGQGER